MATANIDDDAEDLGRVRCTSVEFMEIVFTYMIMLFVLSYDTTTA